MSIVLLFLESLSVGAQKKSPASKLNSLAILVQLKLSIDHRFAVFHFFVALITQ
jgi:hypothetical protein